MGELELSEVRVRSAERVRLRRKARRQGPDRLATDELVHLVAGRRLHASPSLETLCESARDPTPDLATRLGLPHSAAVRLAAAFALARRMAKTKLHERRFVRGPAEVYELLGEFLRGAERECFYVILLDGKHRVKSCELVSVGSLTTSIVHPREVFRPAVRASAAAILCAHNHPSGDPEPSAEDNAVTRRLHQAGTLLGIPMLDHVVLGDGRYVSLRERLGL